MQNVLLIIFFHFLIDQCKLFLLSFDFRFRKILRLALSTNIHRENLTITRGENVRLHCPFPRNYSSKENILQWKKSRLDDDHQIIAINGKIPQTLEHAYRTKLNDQSSSLEVLHVEQEDSTSYICQTFETQTILCQYNLVVLSKYYEKIIIISSCSSFSSSSSSSAFKLCLRHPY